MEVEVTFLTRRGSNVRRRSQRVSAERVHFGRGTDNEVALADIRLDLRAAGLIAREDGVTIDRLGTAPLWVNGQSVDSASLRIGDEILLGPYRLEIVAPPEGHDAAVTIELVQPLGEALETLKAGSRIGLDRAAPSKRVLAWSGALLITLTVLALNIGARILGAERTAK